MIIHLATISHESYSQPYTDFDSDRSIILEVFGIYSYDQYYARIKEAKEHCKPFLYDATEAKQALDCIEHLKENTQCYFDSENTNTSANYLELYSFLLQELYQTLRMFFVLHFEAQVDTRSPGRDVRTKPVVFNLNDIYAQL